MRMALWEVRLPSAWRGVTGTQTTLSLSNDLYEKSLTQLGKKHTKQPRSLGYSKDYGYIKDAIFHIHQMKLQNMEGVSY